LKIALWQAAGSPGDVEANLVELARTAEAAARAGASLLVCPECWLCGYNIGARVASLAEERDGPSARRIAQIARENGLAIVYGYAERASREPSIYNAAQVVGPDGTTLAHYRKTHLFGPDERAAYRPGARLEPPFAFGGFRIGVLICYDLEFPETARCLTLMGADLLLIPTATSSEYAAVTDYIVPARAVENQVYIGYCNHAGVENGLTYLGGSRLVALDGRPVVTAGATEALLIGGISTDARAAAAVIYPYRSDRRPELYASVARTD